MARIEIRSVSKRFGVVEVLLEHVDLADPEIGGYVVGGDVSLAQRMLCGVG